MIKNIFILLSMFIFSYKDAEKQNVNQPLAGCTESLASIDDGNWDGKQGIGNSIFPCKNLIDYVRVF